MPRSGFPDHQIFEGPCYLPSTHNQGPYDTSLAVIRHKKPLKVRLSRRLNACVTSPMRNSNALSHAARRPTACITPKQHT